MFQCRICPFKCATLNKYVVHQYIHRNDHGAIFYCGYVGCELYFKKYSALKAHHYRQHDQRKGGTTPQTHSLKCKVNNCLTPFEDVKSFQSHLYKHIRRREPVNCPFCPSGSTISYKNVPQLKVHFMRHHREENIIKSAEDTFHDEVEVPDRNESEDIRMTTESKDNAVEMFGKFYLTLQSKYLIPNNTLQYIIETINNFQQINFEHVVNKLENGKYSPELVREALQNNSALQKPFLSEYKRQRFYRNNFNFVEPMKVTLDVINDKEVFCYYVPLKETIKTLFTNENFVNICFQRQERSDHTFRNVYDGFGYQKSDYFNKENSLHIILYQDSFELCNPLGSARGKYKITGFYWTLANLAPWHRTHVDHINLLALCKDKDLRNYGFGKVLKPFIDDLKEIERIGLQINENLRVFAYLMVCLGDNLGAHQIGGFVENFRTNLYFCRFCYIHNFFGSQSPISEYRTKESHANDINLASATGGQFRGVKNESSLHSLNYFHVCEPTGLPPCFAHDILEGIGPADIMLCIKMFIKKKIFSYEYINSKLKEIVIKDSPRLSIPPISKRDKLLTSAYECLHVINFLPIFLFEKITLLQDFKEWELILILRKIVKISQAQLGILKDLIDNYIELRTILFPNEPLKPKHHYVTHYPYLIRKFGPLRHLWTMRFESKHKYFKEIIRHSPNFKNVLFSLAQKHELKKALSLTNSKCYDDLTLVSLMSFEINDMSSSVIAAISKKCNIQHIRYLCNEIIFRNITYKNKSYICFSINEFGYYCICKVKFILVYGNLANIYFFGTQIDVMYDSHTGLYHEVTKRNEELCLSYNELVCKETMYSVNLPEEDVYYFKSAPCNK